MKIVLEVTEDVAILFGPYQANFFVTLDREIYSEFAKF